MVVAMKAMKGMKVVASAKVKAARAMKAMKASNYKSMYYDSFGWSLRCHTILVPGAGVYASFYIYKASTWLCETQCGVGMSH